MPHSEYIREGGSEAAVLFTHGICGTPRHFDPFIPLVPKEMTARSILLDGHGKGMDDFASSSMKKWKAQVSDAVDDLCLTHKRVFICAHSMGTLFAINEAVKRPEKIVGLLLFAPPMKIFIKPTAIKNSLKFALGRLDMNDPRESSYLASCSVAPDPRLWRYIKWLPRYAELFTESARIGKITDLIPCPTEVCISAHDELVCPSSANLFAKTPLATVRILPDSGHFHYSQGDLEQLKEAFKNMIK